MYTKRAILSLCLVLSISTVMVAQTDDLKIFGYFQNNFNRLQLTFSGQSDIIVNSFDMQQMNIFFQKNISTEMSSFVNLEFTNTFSSQDNIGGFKIQEAWLKYSPLPYLNIKGGLLIPRFNNFNEIKNRTVLLPYINRPLAYETQVSNFYNTGEFVPTSANLQVYGDLPVGDLYLNYTAFVGNSETAEIAKNDALYGSGQDLSAYKLVGGRLGVEYGRLQFGLSTTFDRKKLSAFNIGYVPRNRIGAYLNYSIAGFELEAEYIEVNYNLTAQNKDTLSAAAARNVNAGMVVWQSKLTPINFDKTYKHVNLLYNIMDNLAAYIGYDYIIGPDNIFISGGINQYNFGACYKVTNAIVLKAQYGYQTFLVSNPAFVRLNMDGVRKDYLVGASVNF